VGLLQDHGIRPVRLLDVGCGSGHVLRDVSDALRTPMALGIDPSGDAISLAVRHQRPGMAFRRATLDEVEGGWDLALCLDVFEHLEDDVGFLRQLGRRVPMAVFRIPLDDSFVDRLTGRTEGFRLRYGHLHAYDQPTAMARLVQAGFACVDSRYHRIPPQRWGPGNALRYVVGRVAPHMAARVLGGWSLLVLAVSESD
jgi:SAM-dependent methyltransferase